MKKLLMASAVLFLFSASIMMFQISCSKTASAGTTLTSGVASKIIYVGQRSSQKDNVIYIKNADGTGSTTTIKPILPNGFVIEANEFTITSDGTYIYFGGSSSGPKAIFRCDMNGSNVIQLTTETDARPIVGIY